MQRPELPPTARHQRAQQERPRCSRCSPAVGQEVQEQSTAQRCKANGLDRLRLRCHCETRQKCTARHKAAGFAWRRSDLGLGLYGHGQARLCGFPAVTCVPTVRMLFMKCHRFFKQYTFGILKIFVLVYATKYHQSFFLRRSTWGSWELTKLCPHNATPILPFSMWTC